jgi:hypothetical protein
MENNCFPRTLKFEMKKVLDMNVYLAPIVDELTQFWITSVPAYDTSTELEKRHF